jgi:competence protein ComEC
MQSWMIGTVAGAFLVGWMPVLTPLLLCAALLCGAAFLCVWRLSFVTLFLLGLSLGFLFANGWGKALLEARLPPGLNGRVVLLQGAIVDLPQSRSFSGGTQRQRFAFRLEQAVCDASGLNCIPPGARVLLSCYSCESLAPGQRWRWPVKLKRPWGLANPGSFNYQSWLAQHGISATGNIRLKGSERLADRPWHWQAHQQLRGWLSRKMQRQLPSEATGEVIRALTIGERGAISSRHWSQLQSFGLNHLVVISGLHVGMVALIGFIVGLFLGRVIALFRPAHDSYHSAHLFAFTLALAYSALAGFALPTVRALVMLACIQLCGLLHRRIKLPRSILTALLMIAMIDPLATHNAGFWMSFGAVGLIAWMLAAYPRLRGWRQFMLLQLALSVATGLVASFWFGGGSWLAPLANLIAVPMVTLFLAPLCLLAIILQPVSSAAAQGCWALVGLPISGFFSLASWLEDTGVQPWLQHQPGLLATVLAVVGILVLFMPRGLPLRWLVLLLFLPQCLPSHSPPANNTLEMTVFDVGQGLAVLARSQNFTMLYDTGGGDPAGPNMATAVILPYLRKLGIQDLDLLVVSHGDRDHAGGASSVARQVAIHELWYGDEPLQLSGLPYSPFSPVQKPCRRGEVRQYGDVRVSQLHPAPLATPAKSNDRSCVTLLDFAGYRILLPGDIGKAVELELVEEFGDELAANLLLAPHHGSLSSSSSRFLHTVAAETAVFSAGYQNRFAHPRPSVLARYERAGTSTYTTANSGALMFIVEKGRLASLAAYRDQRRYYWH